MSSTREQKSYFDWTAAVWSGVVAGLSFLAVMLVAVPATTDISAWVVVRFLASPVLGQDILPPPASFSGAALAVAILTHLVLSMVYAMTIAFIIHRGGLVTGIIGGAFLGLAIYAINFYTFTYFFPWFFAIRSTSVVLAHVLFGALAGGVYEALDVDDVEGSTKVADHAN